MPAVRTFHITSEHYRTGPPSSPDETTNPMTVSLGGSFSTDPKVLSIILLIICSPSPTGSGRRWDRICDSFHTGVCPQPDIPGVKRVWFYPGAAENPERTEKLLSELEAQGIVRRTGETMTRGGLVIPSVDVLVPETEWSHCCAGCGRHEDVGDESRMKHCSRCKSQKSTWYCNEQCQTKDWKDHKRRCKLTQVDRGQLNAQEGMKALFGNGPVQIIKGFDSGAAAVYEMR